LPQNAKSEYRNPKHARISKFHTTEAQAFSAFLNFVLGICFGFHISKFGFVGQSPPPFSSVNRPFFPPFNFRFSPFLPFFTTPWTPLLPNSFRPPHAPGLSWISSPTHQIVFSPLARRPQPPRQITAILGAALPTAAAPGQADPESTLHDVSFRRSN
jgi:hypothetical protein